MDCIVICCSQPGLFVNITCNNLNIHIDSAIHLILNQIRISRGRVKRVLLIKTKTSLQKILIAFRNLLKQIKQEYCHIIYKENFDLYTTLHLMIWFELFPGHFTLWWIWTALGVSGHLSVHSAPICVEYSCITLPCHKLCQQAHSECSKLMELFGVPWPEGMECSRCENQSFHGPLLLLQHI